MLRVCLPVVFVLLSSGCGPVGPDQPCFACSDLLEMTVIDAEDESAIDNFVVEVTVNGEVLGEPVNCEIENRRRNQCAFGRPAGVYEMVLRAPGYETLEIVKRVPGEAGGICATACLNTTFFDAKMRRVP